MLAISRPSGASHRGPVCRTAIGLAQVLEDVGADDRVERARRESRGRAVRCRRPRPGRGAGAQRRPRRCRTRCPRPRLLPLLDRLAQPSRAAADVEHPPGGFGHERHDLGAGVAEIKWIGICVSVWVSAAHHSCTELARSPSIVSPDSGSVARTLPDRTCTAVFDSISSARSRMASIRCA